MPSLRVAGSLLVPLVALALWSQQPSSSSGQASSSTDNAPQPQQQEQPPSSPSDQDTKPESKVKKDVKGLEPQCVSVFGVGKCSHSKPDPAATKQEDQERQLRQQCSDATNQTQPQCVELRKRDSAHDTSVGDDYLSDKHYLSAVNRYCLALQEDPTNSTAKQHLAQALKKSGGKVSGCEASQQKDTPGSETPRHP
jgi:hypothetical protein